MLKNRKIAEYGEIGENGEIGLVTPIPDDERPPFVTWMRGPCFTTAIWRCLKPFSQRQRSFRWKLRSHSLKVFRRRHTAVSNTVFSTYRQVSNIRRTLVGNKIVDHSDVVGASPVGAAPTKSSFST